MTPQSELQRLLGIPPKLWEGELRGMSQTELDALRMGIVSSETPLKMLRLKLHEEEAKRKDRIECDHCDFYHRSPMLNCPWSECPAVVVKGAKESQPC